MENCRPKLQDRSGELKRLARSRGGRESGNREDLLPFMAPQYIGKLKGSKIYPQFVSILQAGKAALCIPAVHSIVHRTLTVLLYSQLCDKGAKKRRVTVRRSSGLMG